MTEQSEIWHVKENGTTRKCLKHGIMVSGCTHHLDCKDCKYSIKEAKNARNKHRKKPSTPNLSDTITVKKRGRKSRNGGSIGSNGIKKPIDIPKAGNNSKVCGRSRSAHQERLITWIG